MSTDEPDGWKSGKLGQIMDIVYGSGLSEANRIPGNCPVYGSNGIVGYHNDALVKGPGVIIGRKGSTGEVTWCTEDFWPIDTTYYIQTKPNIDMKWVYFLLRLLDLKRLNSATGIPGLNRSDILSLRISYPSLLLEQSKIAAILSSVDAAIQETDAIIAQTEQVKRGLMQELLTKGIGHTEFQETPVGVIPGGWNVIKLGDKNHFKVIMGQSPSSSTYNVDGDGLPFLQGNADFGFIYPRPSLYCSNPLKTAEEDDILISVRAPVGEVNLSPAKVCIGRGLSAIRPKNGTSTRFFFYYLKSRLVDFHKLSSGSTFKAINKTDIENYFVPLPPRPERRKIAAILSSVDNRLRSEREHRSQLEILKKGLMQDLLTGRKRVKVDGHE